MHSAINSNSSSEYPTTAGRCLIVRLSALGDVAMTLPVVYDVCNRNPHWHFTLLTRRPFDGIFINRPSNLEVRSVDFKAQYRGFGGMLKLIKKLRSENYDAVADLHNVLRSWQINIALRLKGAKIAMVQKRRSERREACANKRSQKPFIERYREVFSKLGFDVKPCFSTIFDPDKTHSPINIQHPAVGIAPFARYATKTYPLESMRRVIEILCSKGVNVYLFGARGDEARQFESWAAATPGSTSLAGKMNFAEELATMSALDVMVSMDSANQHLASLTGTRVITIWGGTTPLCGFTPFGQDLSRSIIAGVDCQPCSVAGTPSCPKGHLNCMRNITPELVADKILQAIPAP